MNTNKLIISPKTKIYDLLEAYPEAENRLIELVPTFSKLKNPILRRTIARVTTLQQAAIVGGVEVGLLIAALRDIVGDENVVAEVSGTLQKKEEPSWFSEEKIVKKLDARPMLKRGEHPMEMVNRECKALNEGEIFELITDFIPQPLMDMMQGKGFEVYTKEKDGLYHSCFCRIN